jgi:hypothetical protein
MFVSKSKKPDHKWPDTDPPDKSDPFWELNNNFTINSTPYKKEEVEPGRWQWVVNQEAQQRLREYEQRESDLWWALRTRVLTDEEMAEVRQHDYHLLARNMQPYNEDNLKRQFDRALVTQLYLRMDAARDSDTRPKDGGAKQGSARE